MIQETLRDQARDDGEDITGDVPIAAIGSDWITVGHEIDAHTLSILAAYENEIAAASNPLETGINKSVSEELPPDFVSGMGDAGSAGRAAADRVDYAMPTPNRTSKGTPLIRPREERLRKDESQLVEIQPVGSEADGVYERLSQMTLDEPDYFSTFDIAPQPDGGSGMVAMAKTYIERQRTKPATGNEKTVIWAYTHTGLDVRDLLASMDDRARIPEGADGPTADQAAAAAVAKRTRVIIACDSEAKRKAIEDSELLHRWDVKFQVINPTKPEKFTIPKTTALALLPDTLDKLPAHKIAKGRVSHDIVEVARSYSIDADHAMLGVDPKSGRADVISPVKLRISETAEGPELYYQMPQLLGHVYYSDMQTIPLEDSPLAVRDRSVNEFMAAQFQQLVEDGAIYNYVEGLEAIVAKVTESVTTDGGLVYVSGYVRKTGADLQAKDLDIALGGPVMSHVIEASAVKKGAQSADKDAGVEPIADAAGSYGYILIDRSKDEDTRLTTVSTFSETVNAAIVDQDLFEATETLRQAREALKTADTDAKKVEQASAVKSAFDAVRDQFPQAGRDTNLLLEISREFRSAGQSALAEEFADNSAVAAPNISAGLVEQAQLIMTSDPEKARRLLSRAGKISRRNPAVWKGYMDLWDANQDLKDQNLANYIDAASDYLMFAHGLEPKQMIETLKRISSAQVRDFELQCRETEPEIYKTVIIEDLSSGQLRERLFTALEMKAMVAADTALRNADAVSQLLNFGNSYNEDLREAQEYFLKIWKDLAPRDGSSGWPLPRDEWPCENQNRNERWIYNGTILESDAIAEPDEKLIQRMERQLAERAAVAEQAASEQHAPVPEDNERPETKVTNMHLGVSMESEDPTAVNVLESSMGGHMLITGISGMGKTTLYENMFSQLPDMGINFWAFDLGDKGELATLVDNLAAKGVDAVVIKPGDMDKVQVSIDVFRPVEGCSIDAHIGQFINAWVTAYGGGGDSPIHEILEQALREVYAVNGWPVVPAKGETLPDSNVAEPVLPTLQELLNACIKYSSGYAKNTNAGNLPEYFKNRIQPMLKMSGFSEFLVGQNHVDMDKLMSSNVIFDFTNITNHDQRRFLFTALTMQASSYLQFKKGLSNKVNTVWAVDEASLIAKDTGDSEVSRKQAVEMYADHQKVVRGYGVAIWNAMQSTAGIHPDIISQTKTKLSFAVGAVDRKDVLSNFGILENNPRYHVLYEELSKNQPGQAVIMTDQIDPTIVTLNDRTAPTDDQIRARMLRPRPQLPIHPNPYDQYTLRQHQEALISAAKDKQAWKRVFLGATVMAHLAHTELPRQVPRALQRQWQKETSSAADEIENRLLLFYLAKQAVDERAGIVRKFYAPQELLDSTVSFVSSKLSGQTTERYASPQFALPVVRQGMEYQELTNPMHRPAPKQRQFTPPPDYLLTAPVETEETGGKRKQTRIKEPSEYQEVRDRIKRLRQHHLSPQNADTDKVTAITNTEDAFISLFGDDRDGATFWRSMRLATGGELEQTKQRRLVAAALGYISSHYSPEISDFERVLALPTLLRKQLELAA